MIFRSKEISAWLTCCKFIIISKNLIFAQFFGRLFDIDEKKSISKTKALEENCTKNACTQR